MAALIFRLIVIGIIFWIGWKVYKALSNSMSDDAANNSPASSDSTDEEAIVPCEVCGVHVSERRALTHNGKYFCSQEHLDQHLTHQD